MHTSARVNGVLYRSINRGSRDCHSPELQIRLPWDSNIRLQCGGIMRQPTSLGRISPITDSNKLRGYLGASFLAFHFLLFSFLVYGHNEFLNLVECLDDMCRIYFATKVVFGRYVMKWIMGWFFTILPLVIYQSPSLPFSPILPHPTHSLDMDVAMEVHHTPTTDLLFIVSKSPSLDLPLSLSCLLVSGWNILLQISLPLFSKVFIWGFIRMRNRWLLWRDPATSFPSDWFFDFAWAPLPSEINFACDWEDYPRTPLNSPANLCIHPTSSLSSPLSLCSHIHFSILKLFSVC